MAGIGNTILNMLGGTDPEQSIADYSDQQQAQNRAAMGEDPQGNVLPAPPINSAPGVGSGQIVAPSGPPPGTLPAGQEPNATKTPQSWGHLLMDLQRRNEASQGLNQSHRLGIRRLRPAA